MIKEIDQTLHCTVCAKEIPEDRAQRQTATCSEKCKNRLDTIRKLKRQNRKCAYCLHPSSAEERELYRVWRAERGEIARAVQLTRDHTMPNKKILRKALRDALGVLEPLVDLPGLPEASDASHGDSGAGNGHSGEGTERRKGLVNLIERLRELSK